MKSKTIGLRISGIIFGIVAVIHLLRILTAASVFIEGYSLPMWVNVMGLIAAVSLCTWLWWLSKEP